MSHFDNANRLTAINQNGTGTVGFTYDNADRRTLLTLPDAATQAYGYDADSHVTSLTYKHGATTIGNLTYGYDPDGRRSVVGGSLASVYIPGPEGPNAFNADNEMTTYDGAYTLGYDTDGQMTSDSEDTYSWDTRRHLSAISGGETASYVYDALGRRASKTIDGTTTKFVYDGLNPIEELNSSNAVVATMLTGLNVDEYFERSEPGCCGPLSYVTDALGSTQSLLDTNGTPQFQYEYAPFGSTYNTIFNVSTTSSYAYTGREADGYGLAQLYFYRGRYYSPTFQRFISQDPIEFAGGSRNLYAYVVNAPTIFVDPLGLITPDQIGYIIFRETSVLTGDDIDAARIDMAHVILNGANTFGDDDRPPTASDAPLPDLPPAGRRLSNECHSAAQAAVNQDKYGIDPTHGSIYFNERTTDSNSKWLGAVGGPDETPSMILGPFENNATPYHYIDVYP